MKEDETPISQQVRQGVLDKGELLVIKPIMYDANISALKQENELWRCFCYVENLAKNSLPGSVASDRFEKIKKMKTKSAKAQAIGAALLLLYGLGHAGVDPLTETIGYSQHGKALLVNRSDVRFNLSHSGEHVLLTLADFELAMKQMLVFLFRFYLYVLVLSGDSGRMTLEEYLELEE